MSSTVPSQRTSLSYDHVVAGAPVSALDMQAVQETLMWCYGRGSSLVPAMRPRSGGAIAVGTSQTYRFWVKPRYAAVRRMWVVYVNGGGTNTATGTIVAGSGSTVSFSAFSDRNHCVPILYQEDVGTQTATAKEISITVASVTGTVYVDSLQCWEIPRASLAAGSTEYGIDKTTLASGEPIYSVATKSIDGLHQRLNDGWGVTNRGGHFHFVTDSGSGEGQDLASATIVNKYSTTVSTTSNSFLKSGIPLLERRYYIPGSASASTTKTIYFKGLVQCATAGVTGHLVVTMTNGSSGSVTFDSTSYATSAWTPATSFDVQVEDETDAAGLQGGAWDIATVTFYRTGSAGTIYLSAFSIGTSL